MRTTTTTSATYTAAQQITDFGAPQAALTVRVQQRGALGRGAYRQAVI